MVETVTPSGITSGQIGKLQEILGAGLRKSGLKSEAVQNVIETQGDLLVAQLVLVVRTYVEAVSTMIVRRVKVDRTRTSQQVLDATGCRQYSSVDVVEAMPRGDGEEVEIHFFKPGRFISDADLEKEYALYGFVPADPFSLAQVNAEDPSFADTHPNGTHWKDAKRKWCYAAFGRWGDERRVDVRRSGPDWYDGWWFAGLRK